MVNLTQAAHYTRKGLVIGGILLVLLLVGRTALKIGTAAWQAAHPTPPPPATVGFGKLPRPVFPEQASDLPQISYKLETKEGGLPSTSATNKVYFMPQKKANLLALDRAKDQARKMGFRANPEKLSNTDYRWASQGTPISTLVMNITTGSFQLQYDYANDPEIITFRNLPTNQQAAEEARTFLTNNGLLPEAASLGRAEFEYFFFDSSRLNHVSSYSEANFLRVNLFRQDLDEMKILPPDPKNSLISFLFSGSRTVGKRIVEINYSFTPLETKTFATYPLLSPQKAWEKLQKGENHLAHLGQNQNGQIIIRWVYLAYFEPAEPQLYLQPVFVFEGDRNFFAYVPAIDPQWLE